ncbi:MAG: hypothetical protein V4608_03430 [Bacteroidota bacterium]
MTLALETSPALFVLSKCPMYMTLETDAYVVDPGAKAALALSTVDLTENIAGDSFNFKWADETVIMTIVAGTPDGSGTQVPAWVLGQSETYYATVLVTHFKNNYLLSENFDIMVFSFLGLISVIFLAKNYGIEYDLGAETTVTGTGYDLLGTIPVAYVVQDNYKMFVDVYVEVAHKNGTYTKVGTQELDPDEFNMCGFDLSKMVNSKLEYQLPSYNEVTPQRNTQTMKRFYTRYAEKYGSPVTIKKVYETAPIEALKAGFNFLQFQLSYSQIDNHYIANKLFLTRQPRAKKISAIQREYLHWISPDTTTANVVLAVKIYKDDGTTATSYGTPVSSGPKEMRRFASGYDQRVASLFPLVLFSTVIKYEVWVEGNWGSGYVVASEVFTFICDKDYYRDERYFLFTNSDGGIDTFRATGLKVETTQLEGDVLNINSRSPVTGEYVEANIQSKSTVVQNSGHLNREQNKWLDDMFLAEQKWEVIDGGFVPITFLTKEKPFDESQNKPFSFEFEYFYSFDNTVIKSEQL